MHLSETDTNIAFVEIGNNILLLMTIKYQSKKKSPSMQSVWETF